MESFATRPSQQPRLKNKSLISALMICSCRLAPRLPTVPPHKPTIPPINPSPAPKSPLFTPRAHFFDQRNSPPHPRHAYSLPPVPVFPDFGHISFRTIRLHARYELSLSPRNLLPRPVGCRPRHET